MSKTVFMAGVVVVGAILFMVGFVLESRAHADTLCPDAYGDVPVIICAEREAGDGLLTWAASAVQRAAVDTEVVYAHVTLYLPTGSPTYSGQWPYDGSAGCSADIALGTVLMFMDGRTVTCNDRGYDAFMAPHIDVFCSTSLGDCLGRYPEAGNWTVATPVAVLGGW